MITLFRHLLAIAILPFNQGNPQKEDELADVLVNRAKEDADIVSSLGE